MRTHKVLCYKAIRFRTALLTLAMCASLTLIAGCERWDYPIGVQLDSGSNQVHLLIPLCNPKAAVVSVTVHDLAQGQYDYELWKIMSKMPDGVRETQFTIGVTPRGFDSITALNRDLTETSVVDIWSKISNSDSLSHIQFRYSDLRPGQVYFRYKNIDPGEFDRIKACK